MEPVMDRPWAAEAVVDAALAARLISAQFPELAEAAVVPIHAGWDNTVFRVDDRYVFRFPRRQIAVPLLQHELRSLPLLAPRLPAAIPIPVFEGHPAAGYPWPFAGYRYLAGRRAAGCSLDLAARERLAQALGQFLKALHAIPPGDLPAGSLPLDEFERLSTRRRLTQTRERLRHLRETGVFLDTTPVLSIVEEAVEPSTADPVVIAHGDLHMGQILLSDDDRLSAVIDWGDLHLGDRAVDFTIIHQLMPPSCHDAFLEAYGDVDPLGWRLARARAAWHAVALLVSATDAGDRPLADEAVLALGLLIGAGDGCP
jgi:aminoglycoside phosphotransferase (APT) family kinase protein